MAQSDFQSFFNSLQTFIPAPRLISDPLRTLAYGTDASLYRMTPRLVVQVADESEMQTILPLAHQYRVPVTFRGAGTSLSGQAITDSVLLVLTDQWRRYRIADDASLITLQPAIIGGHVNRVLAPLGRKLGPDPASLNACQIGGIAANNASGMCCGTAQNSYQTLASMRLILADGSLLDTGSPQSCAEFAASHRELLDSLRKMAEQTQADSALAERIRSKFKIKNTCGYSLNALVDFTDPIDILQHLMIGSEGTLGFIAEITYNTVPDPKQRATTLILFPDITAACQAVALIKPLPVVAAELMDRASLQSVEAKPGVPAILRELGPEAAALLVDVRDDDPEQLAAQMRMVQDALSEVSTLTPVEFTTDRFECDRLWTIRSGLFPSVGSMRAAGTTVIIEDIAVPIERLADLTLDLQDLFRVHGFAGSIIFGHALEGNLHFVLTPDLGQPDTVERYRQFMADLSERVVHKHDGSLKAEHGTGRNMAPFVELEWGAQAYQLMRALKSLLDPDHILNPGVILNDDPDVHLHNLKPMPTVDPLIDKCIECGFCEPTCPSRSLTLTPRQRITALREMERLERQGHAGQGALNHLRNTYRYQGLDTCAVDSLCALACPVGIDTGKMVKNLRGKAWGPRAHRISGWVARRFAPITSVTRTALGAAHLLHSVLGTRLMGGLTGGMRRLSRGQIPLWNPYMPKPARAGVAPRPAGPWAPRVVYFPSCASRTMGPARGDPETDSLQSKVESVLHKAGFEVVYPPRPDGLCCGQPFESKGFINEAQSKLAELEAALWEASREGQDPIVFDTSPCAFRAQHNGGNHLKVYDLAEFLHDVVLDRLELHPTSETVALHPTCSTLKMGLQGKLRAIAERCSTHVVVPAQVHCCGWSGDRGFTYPELNAAALKDLAAELPDSCTEGYSTSRTCEIGLSLHSQRYYRSIVYLLDRCARAKKVLSPM